MRELNPQDVTKALNGKWYGSYGIAFCPAHHNTRTPALSIGKSQDGRLLLYCHAGCEFTDILAALPEGPMSQDCIGFRHRVAQCEKKSEIAHRIWEGSGPICGTLAETYLKSRRLKTLTTSSLRFDPQCLHPEGVRLPALVAKVDGGADFGIHRTFLAADGLRKAGVKPDKMMLGPCSGGAVRLTNRDGPLVVTEGIETALSLSSGLFPWPMKLWATLSTSGMKALRLPSEPGTLVLAPDGDAPGLDAADQLGNRAYRLGWEVQWYPAPQSKDWNDVLMAKEVEND